MTQYSVNISQTAQEDIRDIFHYISDTLLVPDTAYEEIKRIRDAILSLDSMPDRFALLSDEYLARKGIRRVLVDNYVVFFLINHKEQAVHVIRVLYGRRDWANLLRE
ncbi:MAG: type II toxin-antitoxin system RelE/ParE family toxin [Deltaproteobacteria bacterium]|jgi:toxin ParE1/3/4|nr:type II toxin-antitoxin system RelE/ParE family toxin [Deltaproteobacteria bacterium]